MQLQEVWSIHLLNCAALNHSGACGGKFELSIMSVAVSWGIHISRVPLNHAARASFGVEVENLAPASSKIRHAYYVDIE